MKLSKKQKQVIDFIRRGSPLHFYGDTEHYRQANEKGYHAVIRLATITPLIEAEILNPKLCYDNIWHMELTDLGKTIEL